MRKIKKINGYLVVKFNDREIKEWKGTGLGNYGVIDAEDYTGNLGLDRHIMEFDNAETLTEAIDQARGLNSEFDMDEQLSIYSIIKQTDNDIEEKPIDPVKMVSEWEKALIYQIGSDRYPTVTPATARHQLYGFMVAFRELGILDPDACYLDLNYFEDVRPRPDRFMNLPEEYKRRGYNPRIYQLGNDLSKDCPQNDCQIYLNIFNMSRQMDEQINLLDGWPRQVMVAELRKLYMELDRMFMTNYAIRQYRREMETGIKREPPEIQTAPQEDQAEEYRQEFREFLRYENKLTDSLAAVHGWPPLSPQRQRDSDR
jgi:hypothetical protein